MLDQETVRDILDYSPETGEFRWRKKISRKVVVGKVAGTIEAHGGKRYQRISFFGKDYYAHRLVWLYVHGTMPKCIDHKDLDGLNNALENLRPATHSQNHANVGLSSKNSTGFKGVWRFKRDGTYAAQIKVAGKKKFLGYFSTPERAHAAYVAAAVDAFGEFARFSA